MLNALRPCSRPVLAMSLLLAVACASGAVGQADHYFSVGDYPHAAAAYEASMGDTPSAKSLYRLGVARATPGTEAFDAVKAAQAFRSLMDRYPSSSYARLAVLPSALLKELSDASAKLVGLRGDLDQANTQLEALTTRSQQDGKALRAELDAQQAQVVLLKARVAEQEQALAHLKAQMDQIKRIDLGGPPR